MSSFRLSRETTGIGYPYRASFRNDGGLIREKRPALGWTQKRTPAELGVSAYAPLDWEVGQAHPRSRRLPRIEEFPGCRPDVESAASLVARARTLSKMSWAELGARVRVCEDTLANVAAGRYLPNRRTRDRIEALLRTLENGTDA